MSRPPLKPGDVLPSDVLRDEYGFNAANRPTITVDPAQVPDAFRPLIPLVERWAIPCDVTRVDYVDHQPEADIAAFWHDLLPHAEAIHAWLDAQGSDVTTWPEAAVQFMYLLRAHADAWQPTEDERRERDAKFAAAERRLQLTEATARGLDAFKAQGYARVVAGLAPFAPDLDPVAAKKLEYARKRTSPPAP